MNKEKWLARRRQLITGSDIRRLLGYEGSPLDVLADKTTPPHVRPDSPTLLRGRVAENLIAVKLLADGYKLWRGKNLTADMLFVEDHFLLDDGVLGGSPDFVVDCPDGRKLLLECKSAGIGGRYKWYDDNGARCDGAALAQGMYYAGLLRKLHAVEVDGVWVICFDAASDRFLGVNEDGSPDNRFVFDYDSTWFQSVESFALDWHFRHVFMEEEVTELSQQQWLASTDALKQLYPSAVEEQSAVEDMPHLEDLCQAYDDAKAQESAASDIKEATANQIKAALQHRSIVVAGRWKITHKTTKKGAKVLSIKPLRE